ncbi:MAG: DUF5671 domain-containing protein [bacterium]
MENEISVKQDSSAQDFFLYLVTFLSLAFVSIGEGSILFGFVDKFVTDTEGLLYQSFSQESVKFGIAALFIAGPIFLFVSRIIVARINAGRISLESKIRKWLTYIVLFFASATIIGDLITLVVNFLGGDFTSSFLLKVLVILLIAGGIFGYYFWDMRRTEDVSNINKNAMIVCMLVLGVTFIAAFFIIDSPNVARQKKLDQQSIDTIQSIDNSIQSYFGESEKLPAKLDDLQTTKFSYGTGNLKDIEYKIEDEKSYKLCATFLRSSLNDVAPQYFQYTNEWKHDAGNFCFARTVLKKVDIAPINVK